MINVNNWCDVQHLRYLQWDVVSCSVVEVCGYFGGTCCVHLQDRRLNVLYCDFKVYMVVIYLSYFIILSYDKDIFLLQLPVWIWNSASEIYKEWCPIHSFYIPVSLFTLLYFRRIFYIYCIVCMPLEASNCKMVMWFLEKTNTDVDAL